MKLVTKIVALFIVLQMLAASAFALGVKKDSIVTDGATTILYSSNTSPIDISYNDEVQGFSELYQAEDNKRLKVVLEKGNNYFPMIETIFAEEGIPTELKYLAYIESNYNCKALSRAGARGMWQFMRHTATTYGLNVNRYNDERINPEKATRAAAQYFKKLYAQYNNWHLVVAAYNCGEGMVDYALNKVDGSNEFWDIYKYLPRETRKYVPHFLGIVDAMNSFSAQQELTNYLAKNNATNLGTTNNYTASTAAFSSVSTSVKNSDAPISTVEKATTNYNEVYRKEYFVYIVKQGDSMESIARTYPKNSVAIIKDNNNISSNAEITSGSTLLLEK